MTDDSKTTEFEKQIDDFMRHFESASLHVDNERALTMRIGELERYGDRHKARANRNGWWVVILLCALATSFALNCLLAIAAAFGIGPVGDAVRIAMLDYWWVSAIAALLFIASFMNLARRLHA